ncbi:hypothetical protein QBC44DRAFT_311191 [Cladorrhinum sp. PSN332]|nr:hypothetical protein QBC44DRAFT_311191 [Cladorrhinum sp. PSN332]
MESSCYCHMAHGTWAANFKPMQPMQPMNHGFCVVGSRPFGLRAWPCSRLSCRLTGSMFAMEDWYPIKRCQHCAVAPPAVVILVRNDPTKMKASHWLYLGAPGRVGFFVLS